MATTEREPDTIQYRRSNDPDDILILEVPGDLKVKDANGKPCVCCPTCGFMYPMVNERNEAAELPRQCRRCHGPMTAKAAVAFGDKRANDEHNPQLAAAGRRFRQEAEAAAAAT